MNDRRVQNPMDKVVCSFPVCTHDTSNPYWKNGVRHPLKAICPNCGRVFPSRQAQEEVRMRIMRNDVRRGDEIILLPGGQVGRLLTIGPRSLSFARRMDCDAHDFHTYYQVVWWWHQFWTHFIGF